MRYIKGLLIVILILGAIFVGGGLLLPSQVHLERSTTIQAQPAAVFPYVNDLHRFNE